MKTILYILLLNMSALSFAQDPSLFENTWYLHSVIINGQSYIPPSNSEVPFIPLDFFENSSDDFVTNVCNSFSGLLIYGNQSFTIQDYALTLAFCDLQENTTFEGIYLSFFFDPTTQDPYSEPFLYSIVINGNEKTLILENINGDKAIYGDQILSSENFQNLYFAIHPNPTKNELFLTSTNTSGNLKIKIFNIEGKLLSTQTLEFEKRVSLDVSQLSSGIYFLDIEDGNGNSTIKKFIKE
ncbi:T9SS type A sorting domain-containing protein [Aequorivita lipolytica]|uniref:T9SS type A sorting domain-containing protein n=1 Tax=Aequorivita lipolytica TaxID=153267 RepID=A0A5C6YSB7_9FLAO|nr:T9SS type A sorting domain-containing protein [Aequorivita lipolytica]TXD70419.1 T9SS type A sorting domain-containing protein [Aequorivita lipolytica]SRX50852.1 hypothetical protein AEQU2_01330 [Aequorivita lipolytica]